MQLNTQLLNHLEMTAPERLKGLFLWLNINVHNLQSQSQCLDALISEVNTMPIETCYRTLAQLALPDLIQLSLLNEFGPQFARKASFSLLEKLLSQQLCGSFSL